jgi:uncharacterized protein YeeX (DUF496 family)
MTDKGYPWRLFDYIAKRAELKQPRRLLSQWLTAGRAASVDGIFLVLITCAM